LKAVEKETFQSQVELLSQGPGCFSGEMLATAHLKTSRAMDTLEKTEFSAPADGSSFNDPLRKDFGGESTPVQIAPRNRRDTWGKGTGALSGPLRRFERIKKGTPYFFGIMGRRT
jgi:hypothetical protein